MERGAGPIRRIARSLGLRRSSRARLEAERQRLVSIIEHSADAIVTKDADGLITEWNRGAEHLYGYTREEAIGQPIALIVPPERAGEASELLQRALAGETTNQRETVRRAKDGRRIEVSVTVSPLPDAAGRPAGAAIITRDITRRKVAERQLTGLFEHIPTGLALRDLDGRYLRVNQAMAELYELSPAAMIGHHPAEMLSDQSYTERIHEEDAELLSSGQSLTGSYAIRRTDGTVRDYHTIRYPVLGADGAACGFGSFALDVSESRRSEREREAALEELAEAQAIAHLGSWRWDLGAARGTWSAELTRMLGRESTTELPSREDLLDHIHPADRAAVLEVLRTVNDSGAPAELDCRVFTAARVERVLHVNARLESPGILVGTAQDVTELRRAERQARAAAERLRNVLDNAPIGMALTAPDGRWLQVNRAMREIVGYSEEEVASMGFSDLTHPDDLDANLASVAALLAREIEGFKFEKRYRHKLGHDVWVALTATLTHDETDDPLIICQVQDITSERAARLALAESERRFSSIAANLPGMVYRYVRRPDGSAELPFVSAAAADIYEMDVAEIRANPDTILSRVHPDDAARVAASIAASANDLSRWDCHCRHLMPDGRVKHLHAVAQPVREDDGAIAWDGVIMDETSIREAQAEESRTQQRLQTILSNLAGSAITIYDREQRLLMCEGPLFAHVDIASLIGQPVSAFVDEATHEMLSPVLTAALQGRATTMVFGEDDQGRTLAIRTAPYQMADGRIEGALVHWHDITSVRAAELARDVAQDRFRAAFERAPIGMAIMSRRGRLERVNQAYCEITGYADEDLREMEPFALVHPDEVDGARAMFDGLGAEDTVTIETRVRHADGHYRWQQSRITLIRDTDGQPLHALAQVIDTTDRRAYEERLRHLADHDALTGLLNRRGFEAALSEGFTSGALRQGDGALLLLDLDGFKAVNDTLGHAAGDDLLVRCAHAIAGRLCDRGTLARLGGDEFALLLPGESQAEAEQVARALIRTVRLASAGFASGELGPVTASVGVAMVEARRDSETDLLARADRAMYRAKAAGRDRYAVSVTDVAAPIATDASQSTGGRHTLPVS